MNEALKRRVAKPICWLLARFGVHHLTTPIYAGLGCIFAFHRAVPPHDHLRLPSVAGLEVTPDWLEKSIEFIRSKGYDIVSLDSMVAILRGEAAPRRFAVFTFDDGYEDNYSVAYPVFRKLQAPFTVYVSTSFPERRFVPWWFLLEDLILSKTRLDVTVNGHAFSFDCYAESGKEAAFYQLRSEILEGTRVGYRETLRQVFEPHAVSISKYSDLGMSWEQIQELSRDPLVTIGSHGVEHLPLAKLPAPELAEELLQSRITLERRIGKKVSHFCFPHGGRGEAGPREFEAAKKAGYATAVTTRAANIFPEHRSHLHSLPRGLISGVREGVDLDLLNLWLGGTIPALENRFARIITT